MMLGKRKEIGNLLNRTLATASTSRSIQIEPQVADGVHKFEIEAESEPVPSKIPKVVPLQPDQISMTTTNNETSATSVMLPKTCLLCLESCDSAQNPLKEVTSQHRTRMYFLLTKLIDIPTNSFDGRITSSLNVCSNCYEMIKTSNRPLVCSKRQEKKLKEFKSALRKSILTSENERRFAQKTDATATNTVYEKIRKTVCTNNMTDVGSDEQSKNLYQSRPIGRPPLFGPVSAISGPDIGIALDVESNTYNEPEIICMPVSAVEVEGLQDPLGEFPTSLVQQDETELPFLIQQHSPNAFPPEDQSESVLGNCEQSIGTNLIELDGLDSEMNGIRIRVLKKCSKCDLSFLNHTLLANHEQHDHIPKVMKEDPAERKRRLAKERKKRWRARQTPESLERIRRQEAEAQRLRRKLLSPEQLQQLRESQAQAQRQRRQLLESVQNNIHESTTNI